MNPHQFGLFPGFYFYVRNVNAANDAQRVILLSSFYGICCLKKQLPWPIAVLRFIWVHHLIGMDVPKAGKIVLEILHS